MGYYTGAEAVLSLLSVLLLLSLLSLGTDTFRHFKKLTHEIQCCSPGTTFWQIIFFLGTPCSPLFPFLCRPLYTMHGILLSGLLAAWLGGSLAWWLAWFVSGLVAGWVASSMAWSKWLGWLVGCDSPDMCGRNLL